MHGLAPTLALAALALAVQLPFCHTHTTTNREDLFDRVGRRLVTDLLRSTQPASTRIDVGFEPGEYRRGRNLTFDKSCGNVYATRRPAAAPYRRILGRVLRDILRIWPTAQLVAHHERCVSVENLVEDISEFVHPLEMSALFWLVHGIRYGGVYPEDRTYYESHIGTVYADIQTDQIRLCYGKRSEEFWSLLLNNFPVKQIATSPMGARLREFAISASDIRIEILQDDVDDLREMPSFFTECVEYGPREELRVNDDRLLSDRLATKLIRRLGQWWHDWKQAHRNNSDTTVIQLSLSAGRNRRTTFIDRITPTDSLFWRPVTGTQPGLVYSTTETVCVTVHSVYNSTIILEDQADVLQFVSAFGFDLNL